MKTIEIIKNYRLLALMLFSILTITSCSDDDDVPEEENEVEVITDVTLVFTNTDDNTDVVRATAEDSDAGGVGELEVDDPINLTNGVTYTLTFEILNALNPNDIEDIGDEILDEDDEHQIFFSFTEDAFRDPMGDGNIDSASDSINYNDEDSENQDGSGNPVGLSTTWTAGAALMNGEFTVRLQHQPDIKSATTGADDGDTDFDLTFVLNIENIE